MLKKSYYNQIISVHENRNILLFNSRTAALTIMNREAKELYDNIENVDKNLIQDEKQKEYLNKMIQNGFVIDEDIDELKLMESIERIARYNDRSLTITIAPTTKCNMACPYCYEQSNIKTKPAMDEKIKKDLINFVKAKLTNTKMFKVCWYGGEPLLEKETIMDLSKEFIKITDELGIKYGASMVSNGVLLDYETAIILKEQCKVSNVQITLDGTKEINDKRRLLKDGKSSFDIITKNVEDIKDILNVTIRINADKDNLYSLQDLVDYILNIKKWGGKVKFYIYPVLDKCNGCNHDDIFLCKEDEFSKAIKEVMKKVHNNGSISFMANSYLKPRALSCGATKYNSFLIDANGDIYKCWSQIGEKDKSVGNVACGDVLNSEHVKWLTLDIPKECEVCKQLPVCKGGCGLLRINNGNKPVCDVNVLNYKDTLEFKYREHVKSK